MNLNKLVPFFLCFLFIRPSPSLTWPRSAQDQTGKIWIGSTDIDTPRWAIPSDFQDRSFVFCRGYYKQNYPIEGINGWYVDYPGADYNFMVRLSELTKTKIRRDFEGNPIHVVLRLDSPLLFNCPMVFLSDVGAIGLTDSEVDNLRLYLQKGGFLWADDFWGSKSWEHWESQLRRILSQEIYPMIDISKSHPIMNQFFSISEIIQIPNVGLWQSSKKTSELGEDSKDVHFRGIEDYNGRLMVVITHNTDIGESWEREMSDTNGEFFYKFSSFGYQLGINILIYALTH